MAGNLTFNAEVPGQPFVVQTTDAAVQTFLGALHAGASGSDLYDTRPEQALWAVEVDNSDPAFSGKAYIVSPEAHKRLEARRY